ncbi:MAG: glycosyltransferase family 4 protein, partial [Bacteroidales bacterium]|nr:glycosyltransferase family 4 protein [Bacteroidales bacterium]
GYSAIEMADMGLPLVVSDGTALRDIYHDGENAFVASIGPNVNDTEYFTDNLADALHKALTATPTRKKNMVAANRRLIRTDFSVDTMVRGYLDVMQALTA